MTTTPDTEFELVRNKVTRALKEHMVAEARTPEGERTLPCDVYVSQVKPSDEEELTAEAVVTYVTYAPKEKQHSTRIKFKYDKSGKFQKNTISYV
jgi:hypothetical protein